LQESFPVKPVAALLREHTRPGQAIATSYPYSRPSLNFYSDRMVFSVKEFYQVPGKSFTTPEAIDRFWQETASPYLLLDQTTLKQVALPAIVRLGDAENFVLITRSPK